MAWSTRTTIPHTILPCWLSKNRWSPSKTPRSRSLKTIVLQWTKGVLNTGLLQQIQPWYIHRILHRLLFRCRRQSFLQPIGCVVNVRLGDSGLTRITCRQLGVDGHHMFVREVGESGGAVEDFPVNFPVAIRTALMMDPMSTEDSLVGGILWRLNRSYVLDSAGEEL